MKKSDLKQLIKPLVKECIHEVLLEEGLLSNVVAEVAKGMQGNLVVETRKQQPEQMFNENLQMKRKTDDSRQKLKEHRKKLLDAVGQDAYNGVNLFEDTTPIKQGGNPAGAPEMPSVLGDDPTDAGVDIGSIMGNASRVWQAMK
jgi:hypothetical protein